VLFIQNGFQIWNLESNPALTGSMPFNIAKHIASMLHNPHKNPFMMDNIWTILKQKTSKNRTSM